jgi:hypothetical protein
MELPPTFHSQGSACVFLAHRKIYTMTIKTAIGKLSDGLSIGVDGLLPKRCRQSRHLFDALFAFQLLHRLSALIGEVGWFMFIVR